VKASHTDDVTSNLAVTFTGFQRLWRTQCVYWCAVVFNGAGWPYLVHLNFR